MISAALAEHLARDYWDVNIWCSDTGQQAAMRNLACATQVITETLAAYDDSMPLSNLQCLLESQRPALCTRIRTLYEAGELCHRETEALARLNRAEALILRIQRLTDPEEQTALAQRLAQLPLDRLE